MNNILNYLYALVDGIDCDIFKQEISLFIEREKSEQVLYSLIKYIESQNEKITYLDDEGPQKKESLRTFFF